MKNTRYLFDETQSRSGMVSVSQLQTFLSCKKKWEYGYIENLTPRVEKSYLTIGKLCHKGMQTAMYMLWQDTPWERALKFGLNAIRDEWTEYMNVTPMLTEELSEMDELLLNALSVFSQAFREFEPWKYEVLTLKKSGEEIPALELHFKVPCPPTKGLHGYIDAILKDKETGFLWCVDYKFRKSLAPDDDEAFNIQNAVYAYACAKMGIPITGTMTWQHLNTPASDPQILKDGKISRAKIKTTWEHYERFCREHGQDPSSYAEEMQDKLSDIEWFRATLEYRNEQTINRMWDCCVKPVAKAVKAAYNKSANNYRSLYPWNCKMCQFQSLCQAELRDYDAKAIREREYNTRPSAEDKNTLDK